MMQIHRIAILVPLLVGVVAVICTIMIRALPLSATLEEIMEVLKLCVVQGVQACNLCVPILAEELERIGASQNVRA
jgi:hypothetical protein